MGTIERRSERKKGVSMDRSAQNIDRSSESEIRNLRRWKYAFDVSPLEIIHNEDFIHAGGGDISQINLLIHVINPYMICQYWSLKSDQQLNSSSCHDQRHRDHHHHLRDDDDDEDMIMITCEQPYPTKTADILIILDRGVFDDDHSSQKVPVIIKKDKEDVNKDTDVAADDYIMSQLNVVDAFYELEWIGSYEQLEKVKRCIIQRISEAKLAVQLSKPKTVRIRVDLSISRRRYYANPAAAASACAEAELYYRETVDECFAIHYPAVPINYDDVNIIPSAALRSSQEALETKIFKEEDLISSSSSCSLCSKEFLVGVDVTKKMPCSHLFHSFCLAKWLLDTNKCPLCHHELPTFHSRFQDDQFL